MNRKYASMRERILANSILEGDCWIWTGQRNNQGYGRLSVRLPAGRHVKRLAHRVSYEAFIGPLDARAELGHSAACLSRACVNPSHVAPVSRSENVAQTWKENGRRRKGGSNAGRKNTGREEGETGNVGTQGELCS